MSTYSALKFELIGVGEQSGTWGVTTNTNIGTAIEEAITGTANVVFSSADVTLTLTNTNSSQAARNLRLNLTGTTGAARNLVVPSIEKLYLVNNTCADAVTVKTSAGTGIAVPAGKTMWVFNDGTNVVDATTHLSSLTLGTALAVAQGGTGATSASSARTNLGATTLGANIFTVTNPGAITFPRFNADNTISSLSASDFRTAIGAGTGNGSVTSITAGTGLSGGTITGTGTIAIDSSVVTLSGTQALSNKTLNGATTDTTFTLGGALDEKVFAVTGTTPALSPQNGTIQTWTLSASSTPTAGTWNEGESMTLMINDTSSVYTVTWTSLPVTWVGGSAPTLIPGGGFTIIEFWKVGTTVYGALVGQVA